MNALTRTATRPRHFVDLADLDTQTLEGLIGEARRRKAARQGQPHGAADPDKPLEGRVLALIFDKHSTRTRISFDIAMRQLGGTTLMMSGAEMQLAREETIADTARVLSRYVDAVMIRTGRAANLDEFADHAAVPVINGLTDHSHPCQIMADVMTLEERLGPAKGKIVAWSGDGNNVANSWIQAAVRFDFTLRVACPEPLRPPKKLLDWAAREGGRVSIVADPLEAGRRLNADYAITGNLEAGGDAFRVTFQLDDVHSGARLWSTTPGWEIRQKGRSG